MRPTSTPPISGAAPSRCNPLVQHLQEQHALEEENSQGLLHLFRNQADADRCAAIENSLKQFELPRQQLKGQDAIREVEPAFQSATPIAGALYYPKDAAGNCVLFVKQLRAIAQSIGVQFHFSQSVKAVRPELGGRVSIDVGSIDGDSTLTVDGVVLAAGMQNLPLLKPLGLSLPLCPVQSYNAMAAVKNLDEAPNTTLFDETYKVAIARVGNRIRVSGLLGFLPRTELPHPKAIASLLKVANDYYPNAANFNTANFWSSTFALQPQHLQEQHALEEENSQGLLHLFRNQADADRCAAIENSLKQFELPRQQLKGQDAIREVEPAFQSATPIAGALYYPKDAAGNCVLFVKQLRAIAQSIGVQFHFSQSVKAVRPELGGRVSIDVGSIDGDSTLTVDGVVLAAGMQNLPLLKPLGLSLPLCPVQSYNAMAAV
ncbi:FAD-dependent oxidoreductase, partial [Herbaspirillum lusitanum]|uniref:FAD-dependent oxidoreductase n=1 Tax=Herbaspirillum lusitanum TaxID=213312 RepID=UPI001EE65043